MSHAHLRQIDLTLLLIFDLLLERGNMSKVAGELGVTQSAVSHAVGRLRSIFADPLFVRQGAGIVPTPRAMLLGPMLRSAIEDIRAALAVGHHFDPSTSCRQFRLAAPDTVIAAIAPLLLNQLVESAPHCLIVFRTMPPGEAATAVADGVVDIAVGNAFDAQHDIVGRPIPAEAFGVVCRVDHPALAGGLDLETYCRLDHLLVAHDGNARGIVDTILGGMGRERRLTAIMPHLMLAFAVVGGSDAVITAPLRACRYAATLFPVAIHAPPFDIPRLELMMVRHKDGLADPAMDWFAGAVDAALGSRHETSP